MATREYYQQQAQKMGLMDKSGGLTSQGQAIYSKITAPKTTPTQLGIVQGAASKGLQPGYLLEQRRAGTAGTTTPKVDTLKVDTPNIPTQPYNLSNLGNNPFGDVRVGEQGRETYKGEGVKLSSGEQIKDLGAFEGLKTDKYNVFGKQAEQIETIEPGFLAKRNDVFAMDILKNTPKVTQENVDKILIDYIKAKDPSGQLYTGGRGDVDVKNTLEAIKSRMGYIPSEAELQQKDLTDRAGDAYDREIADIESQYKAETDAFMKAGAIEDRYTNFNEVNDKIQNTLLEAGKHRAENLYTGMPTDEQINEIAQKAGQDFNTTKKILEGRGFEDLEMQGEFKEKSERPFERAFEDMELNRNRTIADIETKHQRTQTALNEQIDDVKTQMDRTLAYGEKAGALSGAIRSSGYTAGLDNIRNDAIKNMDRLSLRKDWDTEDTAMVKGRVIEDFETNMSRTKQDLESAMNDIKTTNGAALSQYLNEYAPSSSELTRKLNELDDKFAMKSQQAFQMYTQNLRSITDTMTYDTEKILQLESMKQNLQQTNVKNMLANNGMALAGINYGDLTTMLQNGDISPTDYTAMTGYMKTLGISSLQSMGTPNPQDLQLYNQMLEQGMTPQQAITAVTSASPSRFSQGGGAGKVVQIEMNGRKMSVMQNADGSLSPIDFGELGMRTSSSQQQSQKPFPTNYQTANQSQIQEGQVILSKYKDGDKAPRDGYCGQFVNDYIKGMGITGDNLFIDPITEKTRYVNSDIPTPGSIMIMDSKTSPQYGHVGVVESVNADGTVNLKEANWNGDGLIHTRTVDPNNMGVNVYGYFDPTKGAPAQSVQQEQQSMIHPGITMQQEDILTYDLQLNPQQIANVAAITRGDSPPISGFGANSEYGRGILAGLGAIGYDAVKATMDWEEMKKLKATVQGATFKKLEMATKSVAGSVEQARKIYDERQSSGLPSGMRVFNKASLNAASELPGEAGVSARTLISHIDDMQAELATVYRQGNSPTDAALEQARRSLDAAWNKEQFEEALKLIEQNIRIRQNSLKTSGFIEGNQYSTPVQGTVDIYSGQPNQTPYAGAGTQNTGINNDPLGIR